MKMTPQQKLEALAARFYQGMEWEPKAGDLYTTSRADLEVYRVVSVEDGIVTTEYTETGAGVSEWPLSEFTTEGFGPKRVWIPPFVVDGFHSGGVVKQTEHDGPYLGERIGGFLPCRAASGGDGWGKELVLPRRACSQKMDVRIDARGGGLSAAIQRAVEEAVPRIVRRIETDGC